MSPYVILGTDPVATRDTFKLFVFHRNVDRLPLEIRRSNWHNVSYHLLTDAHLEDSIKFVLQDHGRFTIHAVFPRDANHLASLIDKQRSFVLSQNGIFEMEKSLRRHTSFLHYAIDAAIGRPFVIGVKADKLEINPLFSFSRVQTSSTSISDNLRQLIKRHLKVAILCKNKSYSPDEIESRMYLKSQV